MALAAPPIGPPDPPGELRARWAFLGALGGATIGAAYPLFILALESNKVTASSGTIMLFALVAGGVGGAVGLLVVPWYFTAQYRDEHERLLARQAAMAAALQQELARLRQLLAAAQSAAMSLPVLLGQSELAADRAQEELRAGRRSPFWEAIEDATQRLAVFDERVRLIQSNHKEYSQAAKELGHSVSPFSLGAFELPDPASTHRRLSNLYREAQLQDGYAIVYEQRRTSEILVAGFGSLGRAIEQLGARIVGELHAMARELNVRLGSMESSLRSVAQSSNKLCVDSRERADREREALEMLDNIQRRRRP